MVSEVVNTMDDDMIQGHKALSEEFLARELKKSTDNREFTIDNRGSHT
jgi:hypothetical protein